MNAAQLINQTSGVYEYFTPPEIIEAARATMGCISLDPFSSAEANKTVQADYFYSLANGHDGFRDPWYGMVWCNHPFGRPYNNRAVKKIEYSWRDRLDDPKLPLMAICCITYSSTSESWFQPLLLRPQCFLHPRTDYYLPDGTKKRGVTKGSVVTYYGHEPHKFAHEFRKLGVVKFTL